MGDHWTFIFRWRCRAIVDGSRQRIWSVRNADHLIDGEIKESAEIGVFSVRLCRRWRWHRGECR